MKLSFIGAGSMAEAMISGLIENRICRPDEIFMTNRMDEGRMQKLHEQYGVQTTYNMAELLRGADLLVFAVKPKDAGAALEKLEGNLDEDTLFVSVMAGISIEFLEDKIGSRQPIIRAMPNTSAAVGKAATAIACNGAAGEKERRLAHSVFSSFGMSVEVGEDQLDAVTGLSGSGPAYIYFIVEAMEASAEKLGLDRDTAKKLIIQTIAGAADMLKQTDKEAADLRKAVTSPGGTTEAGLAVLSERHVQEAFIECIEAAAGQSKKLGSLLSAKA